MIRSAFSSRDIPARTAKNSSTRITYLPATREHIVNLMLGKNPRAAIDICR